ncbi:hypothetical protein PVK06_008033 [Gossypium arboreum]|uniref:Uncharacterized protein n=1 Tax=Gossypium arboreum TaxID=29729 RepID=A0ABR0QK46_GOSAR|nr:hypothetical protein PVK06_008033 [Gossypium arboreum]
MESCQICPFALLRQYRSRQFIVATQGLAQCEFSYKGLMRTPEYNGWWSRRINDNTPGLSEESAQLMEEYLQVVPSKLEIIKQDFERRNSELGKKIEQPKEEKMHLRLDVDVQKLEAEKLRKGKNKAEEYLDSLKMDYKKFHLSMRTAGLEKMSEQW